MDLAKDGSSSENQGEFTGIVKVITDLVEEGSSSENHGEFTGIVRVVVPGVVLDVPGMETTRKPHHSISLLPPNSETITWGQMSGILLLLHSPFYGPSTLTFQEMNYMYVTVFNISTSSPATLHLPGLI